MKNEEAIIQRGLFEQYLNPIKLKEGKSKCPCCGKRMRSYCKTLDQRLVNLAWDIMFYLKQNKTEKFTARHVWDDHEKINDFQKLHYWGIIERDGRWTMTYKGKQFLMGSIQLPKRVWVFNNRVVMEEDNAFVTVDKADPRWQQYRTDYTLDYVPRKYQTNFQL